METRSPILLKGNLGQQIHRRVLLQPYLLRALLFLWNRNIRQVFEFCCGRSRRAIFCTLGTSSHQYSRSYYWIGVRGFLHFEAWWLCEDFFSYYLRCFDRDDLHLI